MGSSPIWVARDLILVEVGAGGKGDHGTWSSKRSFRNVVLSRLYSDLQDDCLYKLASAFTGFKNIAVKTVSES